MTSGVHDNLKALCRLVICAAALCLISPAAQSQTAGESTVEERPGYVPTPDDEQLPPIYQKQVVFYRTTQPPGTIIVDTAERHLYLIQGNSRAIRYGVGVGRDGFRWEGLQRIVRKAEWPDWTPPAEMIARQP
jgi:lipoprotein-anchoring transpeptidase ErfK/SrfK